MPIRPPTVINCLGQCMTYHLGGRQTGGAYEIFEVNTPPGLGAPPHIHTREDESFFVVEGEARFTLGDEAMTLRAGQFVFAPRNTPHSFLNTGSGNLRLMVTAAPANTEAFFAELNDRMGPGAPDPVQFVGVCARHGLKLL